MAKKETGAAPRPPRGPTTAQLVAAIRYLARETKREAEVATLLGDEVAGD